MKTLLLFGALALSINAFGQSKKEQVIALNTSIDSLNIVLATIRDNAFKAIGVLNSEITQLKSDVSSLESSSTKLTKDNEKLKLDLAEVSKKNLDLEAKLKKAIELFIVKAGNFEVAESDMDNKMNWTDATAACKALGNGWRLPTKDELHLMFEKSEYIGGLKGCHWSSTRADNTYAWRRCGAGKYDIDNVPLKYSEYLVRAVKDK